MREDLGDALAPSSVRVALVALLIAVGVGASFGPSLNGGFVHWDDAVLIVDNPYIRRLGWEQIRWMFTSFHEGPYQPVPWLSLALDYHLWGLNPVGFHLTSIVWHAATAVSFFLLSRRLLRMAMPGAAGDDRLLDLEPIRKPQPRGT